MAAEVRGSIARDELYRHVWSRPLRTLAAEWRVSDVCLAKTCRRLGVPLLGRGWWAKRHAGKPVRRQPLPLAKPGQPLEWVRDGGEPKRQPRSRPEPADPAAPYLDPDHLPSRHPLLVGIEPLFARTRTSRCGYLRPKKQRLVDVFATAATLPRALELLNALFLACERRGHTVSLARHHDYQWRRPPIDETEPGTRLSSSERDAWSPGGPTLVTIGSVALALTLVETCAGVDMRLVGDTWYRVGAEPPPTQRTRHRYRDWTATRNCPTGRFVLRATSPYDGIAWERWWRESSAGDLARWIDDIVPALEQAEPALRDRLADRERARELARHEAQRRECLAQEQERQQQRATAILASLRQLQSLVDAWTSRTHIERFLADAIAGAQALPEPERAAVEERARRTRALLNPKTALERLLAWRTPEERLPEDLRAGAASMPLPIDVEMTRAPEQPSPSAWTMTDLPRSWWETRHWWQHR